MSIYTIHLRDVEMSIYTIHLKDVEMLIYTRCQYIRDVNIYHTPEGCRDVKESENLDKLEFLLLLSSPSIPFFRV